MKFEQLIEDQFKYGGKKYGLNTKRESADELFDIYGANWLFGTMDKYTYRFKNLGRERDILKIATYCYILWLKRGFYIDNKRKNAIDTNVSQKIEYFPKFVKKIEKYPSLDLRGGKLESISNGLKALSKRRWEYIEEDSILTIFKDCESLWKKKFINIENHDTDTWNEKNEKT